jgi:hypothetical protein
MPEVSCMAHADIGRNYHLKTIKQTNISFLYRTIDLLAMLKLYFGIL